MTLLELMIASGMLALALSMIFGSLISISVVGDISESRVNAANAVAGVLEQVRQKSLTDLAQFTPVLDSGPGVRRTVTLECYDNNGDAVSLPLPAEAQSQLAALPNPLEVKATLIWEDERGRVFSTYTSTYVGR